MRNDVIPLSISIADRLVRNMEFTNMSEAGDLRHITKSDCSGCPSSWRQKARQAVPAIMERIVRSGANTARLYNLLAGMYGRKDAYFRLPGASKIVFNREGIDDVRSGH